jgi:hypothetical protein
MRTATRILILLCLLGSGISARAQSSYRFSNQRAPAAQPAAPAPSQPAAPVPSQPAATPAAQPAPAVAGLPKPVPWPHRTFNIPYEIEQTGPQPMEVLLLASADRGANWSIYARQYGLKGEFQFRAAGDGEYWFVSRTQQPGMPMPTDRPQAPELRIVVDTTQPQLQATASIDYQGEIDVSWEASDPFLAVDSLQLEYQPALGRPWQTVPLPPPGPGATQTTLRGQKRWKPDDSSRLVMIRVSVQDQAGNRNELIRRLITPFSFSSPPANRPSPERQVASSVPRDPFASYGLGPAAATAATAASESRDAGSTDAITSSDPSAVAGTADPGDVPEPFAEAPRNVAWPSDVAAANQPDPKVDVAVAPQPRQDPAPGTAASGTQNATTPTGSAGVDVVEASTQVAANRRTGSDQAEERGANSYGLPVGERPRMTTARRFNLDYSINAVGPTGVEKVELWATRDGGNSWDLWDVDEDRETPFLVSVDDEGIFGFRVVIVGNNGLASQTPGPGDVADLWVGIDTTPPDVELTQAAYGSEEHAGQLEIQWRAEDDYLADRPVTLKISERDSGPWTTIASGLPNQGQYRWRVDSRVPEQFYLRLEVRDEAGNVGTHQLDRPLKSAGLIPRGYVRGFTPAD